MSVATTFGLSLIGILFIVLFIHTGHSIRCYECNSGKLQDGKNCSSEFNSSNVEIKDCPENTTQCRIITHETDGGSPVITRQCAPTPGPKKCVERAGTHQIKVWYCHCDKDLCNGASRITVWSSTLLISLVLLGKTFFSLL